MIKITNKIIIIVTIIIIIVVKMLNSQFYCCKERLVESVLMISVLQWWQPYTLGNNDWKFDNKVNRKMHFYFWIWVCWKCRKENALK